MDEFDNLREKAKVHNTATQQFGQTVADSYFDELEGKIFKEVSKKEEQKASENSNSRRLMIWRLGAVAPAVLIIFFGLSQISNTKIDKVEYSEVNLLENVDYYLETNELYTEDLLDIEGIDDVLSEIEEELNND